MGRPARGDSPEHSTTPFTRRTAIQGVGAALPINVAAYVNSGFMGFPPDVNELFGLVGQTWDLTFTAPGEYPYSCILHSGGPDSENGTVVHH